MKRRSLTIAVLILLAVLGSGGVARAETIPDVEYARPEGEPQLLDLDLPEGPGPFPAVIFVHGGDFNAGSRKGVNKALVAELKATNIAWVSMDYRLAPKHRFPAPTDDIRSAVRFLKANAANYRLDPNRLALMGESAGVLLVSYVGATQKDDSKVAAVINVAGTHDLRRRFFPTGGCFIAGTFVPNPMPGAQQLCLPNGIAGYLNLTGPGPEIERAIKAASPREHVHRRMPPYLFVHGTQDVNAPFEQPVLMFEAMRAAGAPCEFIAVDKGGHGMGNWDAKPELAGYRPRMVQWIKDTLRS
jgi:acetyl esterase